LGFTGRAGGGASFSQFDHDQTVAAFVLKDRVEF
jgi:hypothetical protein